MRSDGWVKKWGIISSQNHRFQPFFSTYFLRTVPVRPAVFRRLAEKECTPSDADRSLAIRRSAVEDKIWTHFSKHNKRKVPVIGQLESEIVSYLWKWLTVLLGRHHDQTISIWRVVVQSPWVHIIRRKSRKNTAEFHSHLDLAFLDDHLSTMLWNGSCSG